MHARKKVLAFVIFLKTASESVLSHVSTELRIMDIERFLTVDSTLRISKAIIASENSDYVFA